MSVLSSLQTFLQQGGWTLWVMFAVSCLVWARLMERSFVLRRHFPGRKAYLLQQSQEQQGVLARILAEDLQEGMDSARTMIAALPLLGLLGTVAGMIESFDALAIFGNSNVKALSGGISQALISTMVGLVTSLAAMYVEGAVTMRIMAAQRSLPTNETLLEPFAFTNLLKFRNHLRGGFA